MYIVDKETMRRLFCFICETPRFLEWHANPVAYAELVSVSSGIWFNLSIQR